MRAVSWYRLIDLAKTHNWATFLQCVFTKYLCIKRYETSHWIIFTDEPLILYLISFDWSYKTKYCLVRSYLINRVKKSDVNLTSILGPKRFWRLLIYILTETTYTPHKHCLQSLNSSACYLDSFLDNEFIWRNQILAKP